MTSGRKVISMIVVISVVVSLLTLSVSASTKNYDTTVEKKLATLVNDTSSSLTISVNTRPTTGDGGAKVYIRNSANNHNYAQGLFPKHISVPDLTCNIPSGNTRRIYIKPNIDKQQIIGTLTYSMS